MSTCASGDVQSQSSTDVPSNSLPHTHTTHPAFISSSSDAAAATDAALNSCRILSASRAVSADRRRVWSHTGSAELGPDRSGPVRSGPSPHRHRSVLQPAAPVIYQRSICFDSLAPPMSPAHRGTLLSSPYRVKLVLNQSNLYINKSMFCSLFTPNRGTAGASHEHHWNPRQEDCDISYLYFNFGHGRCHAHRIRIKFRETSMFCSLV